MTGEKSRLLSSHSPSVEVGIPPMSRRRQWGQLREIPEGVELPWSGLTSRRLTIPYKREGGLGQISRFSNKA